MTTRRQYLLPDLKIWRENKGLSANQAANMLKVDPTTFKRMEKRGFTTNGSAHTRIVMGITRIDEAFKKLEQIKLSLTTP